MKRSTILAVCFVLFAAIGVYAQQAPNSGFETWTNDNKPDSWDASNISVPPFVDYKVVFKEPTNPHSGTYCAKLFTQEFSAIGITRVVPSFITLGKFWFTVSPQAGGYKGGIPFIGKPDSLKIYYRSSVQGSDKAMISFESWKGNHTTLVGGDTAYITTSEASWTLLARAINNHSTQNPDSLNIVISASNLYDEANIAKNSTLYVDDLTLVYGGISVVDISYNEHFYVFADAAANELVISLSLGNTAQTRIAVYSVNGQMMYLSDKPISSCTERIGLNHFGKGVYIVDVTTVDGQRFTQKIAVR